MSIKAANIAKRVNAYRGLRVAGVIVKGDEREWRLVPVPATDFVELYDDQGVKLDAYEPGTPWTLDDALDYIHDID